MLLKNLMNQIQISLAQMSFSFGQESENFSHAETWIRKASLDGSDIVLLPELWASGYDLENWREYAKTLDDGYFLQLSNLAQRYHICIGSSLLEEKDGKAYNTFVLYGENGKEMGVYRKIHRFRLLEEEKWLGAGDRLTLASTPWGPIGLAICYDLRFPEMFRPYAIAGCQLVLIVAEWPERRISHWVKLLQARAIENQMYIAGVNKVGFSQGVKLGGNSMVVDPWGNPVISGDDSEILLTTVINLKEVEKARAHIPVFQDRRTDVYDDGLGKNC